MKKSNLGVIILNKKITLSMFLILFLFLSISSINASDANMTDLAAIDSAGDSLKITEENHIDSEKLSINTDDILSDNKTKQKCLPHQAKFIRGEVTA